MADRAAWAAFDPAAGPPNDADEAAQMEAYSRGYTAGVEAVKNAVLDIDAHATPLGEDDDGFVTGGYVISVGSLHRALGVIGHTAPLCKECPHPHEAHRG